MSKLKTLSAGTRYLLSRLHFVRRGWRLANSSVVAALVAVLAFASPAAAQGGIPTHDPFINLGLMNATALFSANPTPPSGASKCAAVPGTNLTSYCDAPTVNITCGGAIGSTNDGNGVPINWTFTNGSNVCVTVTYRFAYNDSRQTCSFYFYVPKGFATTTIKATLSNGTHESLNENPVDGWQHWFDATGITSLTFTDANGTVNQQLGWGRTATWSIERLCSL